jgi:hypothetical protein
MANELSFVDKLVSDDGVKFTVTANLAPEIYAKLFLTIASSVIVSMLAATLIKNAIGKK